MIKQFLLLLIRFYQLALSPVLGGRCRFEPTCSVYATQCISRFGVAKGSILALKRILRCHPFGSFGFDPPPSLLDESDGSDLPNKVKEI